MIIASGRTFEHRDTLQTMGGWFNRAEKQWQFERLTPTQLARLRSLVGVIVHDDGSDASASNNDDDDIIAQIVAEIMRPNNGNGRMNVYGDDPTYVNRFAAQNPRAFFGFSSLGAMIDHVDALPVSFASDRNRSGWRDGFDLGTATLHGARHLALNGWQEGLDAALALIDRLAVANPRVRRSRASIAGGNVNVGRMLSGDPSHMISRPRSPGTKVYTFFVEIGCNSTIKNETLIARAALIAAIIELMELHGYKCNIVVTDTSLQDRTPYYQLAVDLKRSDERLNLSDIIFAIGHPAMLRRFSFILCSSVPETFDIWGSQGFVCDAFDKEHRCAPNEFYVPVINTNKFDDPLDLLPYVAPTGLPLEIKKG